VRTSSDRLFALHRNLQMDWMQCLLQLTLVTCKHYLEHIRSPFRETSASTLKPLPLVASQLGNECNLLILYLHDRDATLRTKLTEERDYLASFKRTRIDACNYSTANSVLIRLASMLPGRITSVHERVRQTHKANVRPKQVKKHSMQQDTHLQLLQVAEFHFRQQALNMMAMASRNATDAVATLKTLQEEEDETWPFVVQGLVLGIINHIILCHHMSRNINHEDDVEEQHFMLASSNMTWLDFAWFAEGMELFHSPDHELRTLPAMLGPMLRHCDLILHDTFVHRYGDEQHRITCPYLSQALLSLEESRTICKTFQQLRNLLTPLEQVAGGTIHHPLRLLATASNPIKWNVHHIPASLPYPECKLGLPLKLCQRLLPAMPSTCRVRQTWLSDQPKPAPMCVEGVQRWREARREATWLQQRGVEHLCVFRSQWMNTTAKRTTRRKRGDPVRAVTPFTILYHVQQARLRGEEEAEAGAGEERIRDERIRDELTLSAWLVAYLVSQRHLESLFSILFDPAMRFTPEVQVMIEYADAWATLPLLPTEEQVRAAEPDSQLAAWVEAMGGNAAAASQWNESVQHVIQGFLPVQRTVRFLVACVRMAWLEGDDMARFDNPFAWFDHHMGALMESDAFQWWHDQLVSVHMLVDAGWHIFRCATPHMEKCAYSVEGRERSQCMVRIKSETMGALAFAAIPRLLIRHHISYVGSAEEVNALIEDVGFDVTVPSQELWTRMMYGPA